MAALDGWAEDSLGIVSLLFDGLRYGAKKKRPTRQPGPRASSAT
jgi:hypothetical protein